MANGTKSRRRRRRSAWASITTVDASTHRIRWWGKDASGAYRRMSETVHGTRMDAERRRSELMLAHSEDAPCPTVRTAWESWALPDLERRVEGGDVSASTVTQYRRWWAKHVEPRWGDVPCDSVRPLHVQQWLSTLTLSQAKNATLVLGKVLDYAVRYEVAERNPMRERYVMPSKSTVDARDKGVWSLAELEGAWRAVWGSWMEPAFLLAAFGSCRVGESLGVRAGDVELRDVGGVPVAVARIERQVEHGGRRVTDALKTDQSARVVVMAGRAATRLAALAAAVPDGWYLTHDGFGGVVSQNRYTDAWRAMGMAHPFRNLRNSWQTWMRWELRVDPRYIEPMMGHVIRSTTGRHYDRPLVDDFCRVVADAYRERPYDAGWELG